MTLGEKITFERKKLSLTQDALAQKMGVSNQAVSKWESDLSCPDIMLLPLLADTFGIAIDELFGREAILLSVICTPISLLISYGAVKIIVNRIFEKFCLGK